jgi:hypothetical protein
MIREERGKIKNHFAAARLVGPRALAYAEDHTLDSACHAHGVHNPAKPEEEIGAIVP